MVGGGKRITAEDVARMFKALTGKDSTPEELAKSQKKLDEAYARLNASQQDTPEPVQPIARETLT
jgi:aldehyde:ferredoxin oxidoreductase